MLRRLIWGTSLASLLATSAGASALVCPLALSDGARLSTLGVVELVNGIAYELAPEVEHDGLAWSLTGLPDVAGQIVCDYANGWRMRIEVPEGARLECRTSITQAGTYASALACDPTPP